MKLELQNYAVITPNENSYIKCINNNINSLQIRDRILQKVVQRLSQHNLKILNHRHIQKLRQRKQ
jgi:hypothetical protein